MCNDVPTFHQISQKQGPSSGLLGRLVHRLYYLYDRRENRKVDLTLFLSRWAESEFKLIYPAKTGVVRSGADPDRFRAGGDREKIRKRYGYRAEDFVLLWLGIFMPHRRLQDAIDAVAHLKQRGIRTKLLLAGSGDAHPSYFQSLKERVQASGLQEDVTFAGKVDDEEIRDYYCACDAFVFPNELQTWGLAVLEAMACGCPVLVSEGAAVHEILTDNETAVLFPARQPDALAVKIEMLLSYPELRRGIAEAGMQLVRTKYNWERFAEQIVQAFRSTESDTALKETYVPATDR